MSAMPDYRVEPDPPQYLEPHYRYVVEACDQYPPNSEHYLALVRAGIDPENNWTLVWSFRERADADQQCRQDQESWNGLRKFRVRDTGG
jgi:hypothetical protein